jgi:hypothetical protein
MRLFPAFLMALLLGAAARADGAPAGCGMSDTPCGWGAVDGDDAGDLAKHGMQLFRFRVTGAGYDMFYEIRRTSDGGVLLDMRSMDWQRGEIIAAANIDVWNHVIADWRQFERDVAHTKSEAADWLCAEDESVDFELVRFGKVARVSTGSCHHPATSDILDDLSGYLLAQVPYCARIPEKRRGMCFALKGDRFEAAEAEASFDAFDNQGCKDSYVAGFATFFAPDATMTQDGKTWKGAELASHLRELPCLGFPVSSNLIIDGRPDGSVVISGTVDKTEEVSHETIVYDAPSTQIWRRFGASGYRIATWDIGPFVRWVP